MAHSRSVQIALDAAKQLEGEGIDCEVGLHHCKQTSYSKEKKMIRCYHCCFDSVRTAYCVDTVEW